MTSRLAPRGIHPAWIVGLVALVALIGAAGFRAAPGVLMVPIHEELGWSTSELSLAVTVNLFLFGLTAPFAAALMQRFGIRRVTTVALVLIATGSLLSTLVRDPFQLVLTWGVLVGLGTGSMALVFAATVTDTWFVRRRGLVSGVLTAGSATGQLIFLPVIAVAAEAHGWRAASIIVAAGALAVVPLVVRFLRDSPAEIGATRYGEAPAPDAPDPTPDVQPGASTGPGPARLAIDALRDAARTRTFWALAAAFAICGASTNGLIGTHFVPSAHDHGMAQTTAAGLLALIGVFDIVGTVFSGWLTDRMDPRIQLVIYYALRGVSLLFLPGLLSATADLGLIAFIVIYGLDWVATVPPTIALCRRSFGRQGALVFGWIFAAHQVGAGIASSAAGLVRDQTGQYTLAWLAAAGLCGVAAVLSGTIRQQRASEAGPSPDAAYGTPYSRAEEVM